MGVGDGVMVGVGWGIIVAGTVVGVEVELGPSMGVSVASGTGDEKPAREPHPANGSAIRNKRSQLK